MSYCHANFSSADWAAEQMFGYFKLSLEMTCCA